MDTAEHRAEMHRIATDLRSRGIDPWHGGRVDVSDVFHNDDLTFEQKRDAIVARIKRLPAYKQAEASYADPDSDYDKDLYNLVDEMSDVDDVQHFDFVWSAFYDWADYARVWVKTF